jgi:Excreted virulence factor EspC, type VII ESX diderm
MMMAEIDVAISELRAHASRVEEVAGRVDVARGAAGQVSMQAEAYGYLCSPLLVPVLGALEEAGMAGIAGSASALDATAMALRTMANSLEAVDRLSGDVIQAAGRADR